MVSKILMIVGSILLTVFMVKFMSALISVSKGSIVTDIQLTGLLIPGMVLTMFGALMNVVDSKPLTREMISRRKALIQSCKCALIMVVIISFILIGILLTNF